MVTWGRCFRFSYFVDRETGIETVSNFSKLSVGTMISARLLTLETKHRQEEGILPVSQNHLETFLYFVHKYTRKSAGSQCEKLRPWQRSWGRMLRHTQGRDRASGNPLFPSIYPQSQSLPTLLFYALTYTSDFTGGLTPITSLGEGVNLQLQVNKNSWAWQECFNLWTPLKVI